MLSLLFAMTAWAGPTDLPELTTDLKNPIYYTISNTRSDGKVMYYTAEGVKDENPQVLTDAHKFFFTGSSLSDVKIHNAEAEKSGLLFTGAGAWNATGVSCEICVTPYGDGTTGLAIKFSDTSLNEQNQGRNGYTTWSANDAGSVYVMDKIKDINWPEAEKFYTIEAPLFENMQGVKKGLVVDANGSLGWNTIDLTSKNCYWTVEYNSENDGYAVKNLGTGAYLDGTETSETVAHYAKFNYLSQCQFNIVVNSTTVHANGHGGGANVSGDIVNYGGTIGSASAWRFVEQQDPEAVKEIEITYNFTYNNQPLEGYTQIVKTVTGAEYPNVTVSFPFGISATKPEGTIAKEDAPAKTVTIAVEENLPFKYAASYKDITKWYYMNVRDDGPTYAYYDSEISYIKATETDVPVDNKDAYTWAFVGNPFDGFSIVNYAAGETMVLSSPVAPTGEQNADELPRMVAKEGATGNTSWMFVKPTHGDVKAKNGFYIQHHTAISYAINRQGYNGANTLCYWTGRDTGSTFQVVERDMTGLADLQALIDQVEETIAAYGQGGTTVGYYTAESIAALNTALAAAETAAEANTSADANSAAQVALQNAVATLAVIQPTEGKFYTISNCKNDHRGGQQIYVNNDGGMQFAKVVDNKANGSIGHVFQFVPAGNNKFYLYNVQRGTYLSTVQGHGWGQNLALATENPSVMVTLAHTGTANIVYITPENSEMVGAKLHAQDSGSAVVGWDANGANDASAWVISEVADITALSHELTVGEAGYATLCLGYNATIPAITAEEGEECGVYTAAVVDGYAAMTKVEGVLPANTAVIVKAAAGTYNFNYATGEVSAIENNELKGTTINKNFTDAAYVLGIVGSEVGLYTAAYNVSTDTTNDGTAEEPAVTYEAWKNYAFKAYLPKSEGSNVSFYGFRFDDEEGTTAVENVEVVTEDVVIFDLSGRRVNEITEKGIYIVNGKKVIK